MTQRALDFTDKWIAKNIFNEPDGDVCRTYERYRALVAAGEVAGISKAEMGATFPIDGGLVGWVFTETVHAKHGSDRDAIRLCSDLIERHGQNIFDRTISD